MKSTVFRHAARYGAWGLLAILLIPDFAATSQTQSAPAQIKTAQAGNAQTKPGQEKPAAETKPALKGFPFTNENLAYKVVWPSGLSLGEGHMQATHEGSGWRFELALEASVPGFAAKDTYRATASTDLCSGSFSKDSVHGDRKRNEIVIVDSSTDTATRHSASGGASTVQVPGCVRDALTFLYFTRRELGQGTVPPSQEIIFGALYNIDLKYAGAETVKVNNRPVLTDKMICHVKGPASEVRFEAYFDRDAARTPVAIRVPLALGKFSLELVR